MKIAVVGCGYVAGFYMATMPNFSKLEVVGAFDIDEERLNRFCREHHVYKYANFNELLQDEKVDIVLNLTWIKSHYTVIKQALLAGKHVYSEKPLTYTLSEGEELVHLANKKNLHLNVAPCNFLGASGQTLYQLIKDSVVGKTLLVHASLQDGPVYLMGYENWKNPSGLPWPFEEEFTMGCVYEHAGYYLSWLIHLFGSVIEVSAFSSPIVQEIHGREKKLQGTDFCVAGLRHESGVCVHFACSSISPSDNSLKIIGEKGIVQVEDCWNCNSPISVQLFNKIEPNIGQNSKFVLLEKESCPLVKGLNYPYHYKDSHDMNFAAGLEELRLSIETGKKSRLNKELALHVLEIISLMEEPGGARPQPFRPKTAYPLEPELVRTS